MSKTTPGRNPKQTREFKLATRRPTQSRTITQTKKQFETFLPDMWEGGTFNPRLLQQEYGYIGIQERSVSETVNGGKQTVPKGL